MPEQYVVSLVSPGLTISNQPWDSLLVSFGHDLLPVLVLGCAQDCCGFFLDTLPVTQSSKIFSPLSQGTLYMSSHSSKVQGVKGKINGGKILSCVLCCVLMSVVCFVTQCLWNQVGLVSTATTPAILLQQCLWNQVILVSTATTQISQ